MKGESSIFKLFLTIELAKHLNNTKETQQYRYVIDLQDQSKSFISQQTQNILFFLNEIENDTYIQVKIVSDKTNKILGQLKIIVPFAINYESEITVTEQFNIDNESKLNGKYTLYVINVPLFNQKQNTQIDTTQSKINQSAQLSTSQVSQKKKQSKSPQIQPQQYYSKESYLQQINKKVNSILSKHNHSMSSKKDKTSETGFVDESPSRISDRVQVSRSGTLIQSEIAPNQVRQYVLEESPSKITCSSNKEINHRHHQDLSCLYYIDQAMLTKQIQMENENLKEFVINLNNKIEVQEQEIIIYRALEQNYNELQNQLKTFLKAQELTKSADTIFDKEIVKINAELNTRVNQLLENEKKFNKQKVALEMQVAEQKKEINMLRENLYELSEKQKMYQGLSSENMSLKSLNNDLKQQILKNAKDYEAKIQKFEQSFTDQNKKFDDLNKQIADLKKSNWEQDKINKAQTFQLKKLQERGQSPQPTINVKSSTLYDAEDQPKQIQVQQEINQQKQAEIERLQSGLKKVQQQYQDSLNEQIQTKATLNQAKQEITKLKEQIAQTQNKKTKQQTEQKNLTTQIETEKQKVNTLQNQVKAKTAQLQEAQAREENYQNKIQKLEQIIKQTRTLIENQEEQIALLNNQIKDLQDIKQKQQNDLKEDKQKMNQLKSLICGMKEQKVAYIPMHGDPIDHALSEYINSVEDPKKLIELFFREQEGLYQIGSKSVTLKTEQGKVFVKVGGGYIGIEEFLDVYLKEKTDKIEKKVGQLTPRQKTPQKSQKQSTIQFTQ